LKYLLRITVLLFCFMISLAGCTLRHNGQVTFLHTNDLHCQYLPAPATWAPGNPKPLIGGMVALDYFIRQQRALYPNSLLLNAGDILTGTQLSKIAVDSVYGGAFVNMMNLMGYDVVTLGNHEFDEGQGNLYRLMDMSDFDYLAANLTINTDLVTEKGYDIYKVGNIRIGIIGLILTDLFRMTAVSNLDGVRVDETAATVQPIIDRIDAKTDLIVLLTHQGIEADVELAKQIRGADIIVGGHTHTRLEQPQKVNDVLIFQAGSRTTNLGRLTVSVADDRVRDYNYELIDTWVDSVKNPNSELVQQVEFYRAEIDRQYNHIIGQLKQDWRENHRGESNIGSFIADAMRETAGVDFALMNNGGIRKELPAGPVKKLDIAEILPFRNYVETFTCSGEQALAFIKKNIQAGQHGESGVLQISGLRYNYKLNKAGNIQILSATIGGKKIDPRKEYHGASVDFILDGPVEETFAFTPGNRENTRQLLTDVVVDYIIKHPAISGNKDGRIQQVK